ncbi:MAG: PAS domain-containing protein [Chloroflexi bacterium]|nr:PAS domain-containing protein [Chloroflexota bacterium]
MRNPQHRSPFNSALRIAILYLIAASVWIVFSDRIVEWLVVDKSNLTQAQTIKGIFFIVMMSVLLFVERKHADEKLQKITFQRASLANNIPQKLYIKDLGLVYTFCNQQYAADFNLPPEDIVGKTDLDLLPEQDAQKNQQSDRMVLEKGELIEFDDTHLQNSGKKQIIHTIKSPIRDSSGAITGLLGIFWDVTEQRGAAEAVRASQQKLQLLIERMPIACILHSDDFCFEYFNPAAEKIFGYSSHQIAGKYPEETIFANGNHAALDEIKKLILAGETNVSRLVNCSLADGRTIHCEWNSTPLYDEQGNLSGIVSMVLDITERLQHENEMKEISQHLQAIVSATPLAVITIDPEGRIISWNPAAEDIFGWSASEAVSQIAPFVPESKRNEFYSILRRVVAGEKITNFEAIRVRKDGSEIAVSLSTAPMVNANGETTGVVSVITDISQQKRDREIIQASQEFITALLENAPVPIYVSDPLNTYIQCNQSWEKVLSKPKKEIIGVSVDDLLPQGAATLRKQINSKVIEEKKPIEFEENIWLGGQEYYFETVKFPLKDLHERVYAVGSISIDITDRKNAQLALEKLNNELERLVYQRTGELEAKNKELETFAYSVSHDLKAPLRGMDGYSRLLAEEYAGQLDEDGAHFVRSIREAANHMNQLIDDLLAYSRLERRSLQLSDVNPNMVVDQLLNLYMDQISSRNIQVHKNIPFDTIHTDSESFLQAIRNLIDNAIKFTQNTEHPEITIGGEEKDDRYVLWVSDNGEGFDEKYAEKVFEIFQRLHRSEEYPGTGIGLAIVRKAMERLGGRVYARSSPGKGATFFLEVKK